MENTHIANIIKQQLQKLHEDFNISEDSNNDAVISHKVDEDYIGGIACLEGFIEDVVSHSYNAGWNKGYAEGQNGILKYKPHNLKQENKS